MSTAHRTPPHHYRDVVGTTVSDSRSGRALTHQQSTNYCTCTTQPRRLQSPLRASSSEAVVAVKVRRSLFMQQVPGSVADTSASCYRLPPPLQ